MHDSTSSSGRGPSSAFHGQFRGIAPSRMSLADYLAKKYLTSGSKVGKIPKKRKRKTGITTGISIADDDTLSLDRNTSANDEEDKPLKGYLDSLLHSVK